MKDINFRMRQKMNEVFSIEPNDLGTSYLTTFFKKITSYLKTMPFIYVIPVTFLISIFMYFVFGRFLIKLVTVLQYGF
ncbi:MAG: hypothetical protein NUV87_01370 [Candidatus Roizmanbacteria bacterium]|jgi:hypothetical protein|nr:hypothetical protein [Candidatus Roizmanbacteria bacterium]MCR4313114.1 hypothetical protein [Candidatus Roizmanbacteria bacterium]